MSQLERTEDCWTLRAERRERPRLRVGGKQLLMTHCVWWLVYREWPDVSQHLGVVQACGNHRCYRPRHLELLSRSEWTRLRADRLDQTVHRECRVCDRPMRLPRTRLRVYCSRRCREAA